MSAPVTRSIKKSPAVVERTAGPARPPNWTCAPTIKDRLKIIRLRAAIMCAAGESDSDAVSAEELLEGAAALAMEVMAEATWLENLPDLVLNLHAPDDDQLGGFPKDADRMRVIETELAQQGFVRRAGLQ